MSKTITKEIFLKSKSEKSLIGIYTRDIGIDDFCVGYVIDFDDMFIVIQHISKYGQRDGIHIKQILTLEKIEVETDYLLSCQILFDNQKLLPDQTIEKVLFSNTDSWQYHFFNDNSCIGELIAFNLKGEDYFNFGFLIDFDQDNFSINMIGQAGENQGINVFHLTDISSFGLDTLNCRKREYLYNFNANYIK